MVHLVWCNSVQKINRKYREWSKTCVADNMQCWLLKVSYVAMLNSFVPAAGGSPSMVAWSCSRFLPVKRDCNELMPDK